FEKTVRSFDPTGRHTFRYFYGLNLPHFHAAVKRSPVKGLLVKALGARRVGLHGAGEAAGQRLRHGGAQAAGARRPVAVAPNGGGASSSTATTSAPGSRRPVSPSWGPAGALPRGAREHVVGAIGALDGAVGPDGAERVAVGPHRLDERRPGAVELTQDRGAVPGDGVVHALKGHDLGPLDVDLEQRRRA